MLRPVRAFTVLLFLVNLACAGLSLAGPSIAADTGSLDVDSDFVDQAELIIVGHILDQNLENWIDQPMIQYQVAVDEVLEGTLLASPIAVQVGAAVPLTEGERVLLALGAPLQNGNYKALGDGAGVFHIGIIEDTEVAYRKLRTSDEAELAPLATPEQQVVRDLATFTHWLTHRAHGAKPEVDYFRTVPSTELMTSSKPLLSIPEGSSQSLPLKVDPLGTVTDRLGDSSVLSDLLSATVRANSTTLFLDVRYREGFSNDLTITQFRFDTDQNIATGRLLGIGAGLIGIDAGVNIGGSALGNQAQVFVDDGTTRTVVGQFPATARADGYSVAVPLTTIADEGFFNFSVISFSSQTGRSQDFMPDLDLPPATTGTGVLAAPDTLQATVASPDQINLTWNDRSNIEQAFEIQRRSGSSGYQTIANVGSNVTVYADQPLAAGMTYTYRVRARGTNGTSDYSAEASATLPNTGEATPTNLVAQALSASEIQLDWTDNATSEEGYQVEMQSAGGFSLTQTLPADSATTTVSGLDAATLYTFRVRATGGAGNSPYSNQASATTFAADIEPCEPSATTLCLNDGRFKVDVAWQDFAGNTGSAVDAGLVSTDSGLLYFFDANNWEMLVKVLDGCDITNHFWVFAAATTDVGYTLTVTDSLTGTVKTYQNALGDAAPAITDTEAFATCTAGSRTTGSRTTGSRNTGSSNTGSSNTGSNQVQGPSPTLTDLITKQGTCEPSDTTLCLNQGRYQVEVDWTTNDDSGMGQADGFQSADSALLWFFSPNNLEMLVKVLDGCAVNNRIWVFAAATTDVQYTLRVTDTETGEEKRYLNPAGNAADAITDTDAFAACQ